MNILISRVFLLQKFSCEYFDFTSFFFLHTSLQNETSEGGLDDILGSTMGDVTQDRLDNFDWSRVDDELDKTREKIVVVSKSPPKIEIEAPTMDSLVMENSFYSGAMSARSTSFGNKILIQKI